MVAELPAEGGLSAHGTRQEGAGGRGLSKRRARFALQVAAVLEPKRRALGRRPALENKASKATILTREGIGGIGKRKQMSRSVPSGPWPSRPVPSRPVLSRPTCPSPVLTINDAGSREDDRRREEKEGE